MQADSKIEQSVVGEEQRGVVVSLGDVCHLKCHKLYEISISIIVNINY
jgi:hypothetical protein